MSPTGSSAPTSEAARDRALATLEEALDRWRPGWDDDRAVADRARAISAHYTDPQQSRQTPPADPLTRAAYLAYFGPRAIGAVTAVLAPALNARPDGEPCPPILEIGAGTGASSLALAALGAQQLTLVDRDRTALDAASSLVAALPVDVETKVASKLETLDVQPDQLVVLSFALAEIVDALGGEESEAEAAVFEALAAIAHRAAGLIVIDAGDRLGARTVQRFRELATDKGLHLRAPCPHTDICPALVRRRDWCHTRIRRELPDRFARVADAIGRDAEWLAFSYLVVSSTSSADQSASARQGGLRVIGKARKEKGRVRLPVCGAGGVRFAQALKRDRQLFRSLMATERGTVLAAPDLEPRGDTLHLSALPDAAPGSGFP